MSESMASSMRSKSVVLVGLGNVGTFSAGFLARLPEVGRLTLLDSDLYELKNLVSQDVDTAAIGRPKAVVQAERLRRAQSPAAGAPPLDVVAVVGDVEDVPLGRLSADLLVACLDSRRARQRVNQVAWRLGIPWVDAGVRADGLLARANVYRPIADQPCLECAWDQRDYESIEQTLPCAGSGADAAAETAPTNAPAALGALAAALQVLECRKILAGDWGRVALGRQVLVDADAHRYFVTAYRRNPSCRFDHSTWRIERPAKGAHQLLLGEALAEAGPGAALGVEGHAFVRRLVCPRCGSAREFPWRLSGRAGAERHCLRCRRRMLAPGADLRPWLEAADLAADDLGAPLRALGLRDGDVFSVRAAGAARHFELGA